jgi:Mg2+-importing ATPase
MGPSRVMHRSAPELALFLLLTASLSILALVGVASAAGLQRVHERIGSYDVTWLPLALAAEALAYVGYIFAYREVARVEEGPDLEPAEAAALVATGFGAFVARGGFALDLHAFQRREVSERQARVRVLGLGALEYAILAPAACVAAIVLLLEHVDSPAEGLTLPWAVGVPAGAAIVLPLLALRRRLHGRGWRDVLAQALDSVYVLRCLFFRRQHVLAPLGTALYWFGDVLCLWACLRMFEVRPLGVAQLVIGYATGYALTRRTLPFAGAGAVEALLPFALLWAGTPLPAGVLAVFMYRLINLWLPIVPATIGLRSIRRELELARPPRR